MLDNFLRVQAWLLSLFLDDSGDSNSDSGDSNSDSGGSDSGSSDGASEASGSSADSSDVSDSGGTTPPSGTNVVPQAIPPPPRPEDLANIPPPLDLAPGDWPNPPAPPSS